MPRILRTTLGTILTAALVLAAVAAAPAAALEVLFVGQQTIENQNTIAITFSAPLSGTQDINRFLALFSENQGRVEGAWVLAAKSNVAYFGNIEADTGYEVQIRKGLRGADGLRLRTDLNHVVRTREAQAQIAFAGRGYILPARMAEGLPVSTLNVTAADIDFFRIRENALVQFIQAFDQRNRINHYDAREVLRYGDLIYSARFDLAAPKNVLSPAVLPIRDIPALEAPGLYLAVLRQAGAYPYSNAATYFTVSDIGLHLRAYTRGMELQTQSLDTGAALPEVRIELYDKESQLLERRMTDADGRASLTDLRVQTHLVIARHGAHISILPLTVPGLDLSAFDLGEQPFRDPELYVYGPRDLYRPGETLIMDALLRDHDGRPVDHRTPLSVSLKQPDGRAVRSFTWHGDDLGAFHYEYSIAADGPTGKWHAEFSLAGRALQRYAFQVEDFMPERLKLTLGDGDPEPLRIGPKGDLGLNVAGAFLYGAPAAVHRVTCHVSLARLREAVPRLPGFAFGAVDEPIPGGFDTAEITLNEQGEGALLAANQWEAIRSPLIIRLRASLYESGGRAVSRDKSFHMWPADELIGLRPLWAGDDPESDSLVEFEVVKSNAAGERLAAHNLVISLIREYPDHYWEFRDNSGWERVVNYQNYPVGRFELDIAAGGSGKIGFPVEWGPYRVEVRDPATDLVTSYRFSAGWGWGDGQQGSRPDQVVLTLDKPAYTPGDTARLMLKAPEAGIALVTVEGDRLLWRTLVPVTGGGTPIAIPIAADWDRHDLYITAMVIRPADTRRKIAPKRSLGVIHLPLERTQRRLAVTIAAPPTCRPNTTLTVDLTVAGAAPSGDLYVSLAAVDVGVLSITDFRTPDPARHFFNRRRYGVDSYDLYQKIIEGQEGPPARMRYGGDAAPVLMRGGDKPMTDIRIVALYRGAVKVDPQGQAQVTLDLPDFNGRLRLMAVAYGSRHFGSAAQELTVAAPVTAEIAMPRFLALGDRAELALDIQNLSGRDQALAVSLTAAAPLALADDQPRPLQLKDRAKTTLRYAVQAGDVVALAAIDVRIEGIRLEDEEQPLTMHRRWHLGTRPAYPAITRGWRRSLEPGQSLTVEPGELENLLPSSVRAGLVLSDRPPIDVAEHVRELYAYPYGCLEQTVSGIYPQIALTPDALARLKLRGDVPEERHRKVQQGIDRLIGLQKPDGGFGLWSGQSPEECWLTAYVSDFLHTAQDQGYEVPAEALAKAVERLQTYLRRPAVIQARYSQDPDHARLAVQAYSAFVLARLNQAPLGTLRALFDNHQQESRSSLPLVHLGLALDLQGDGRRARQALVAAEAVAPSKDLYLGDYGSPLRDAALSYTLLATHAAGKGRAQAWVIKLDDALRERQWLSTQERNALVLAGLQLTDGSGREWTAHVELNQAEERLAVSGTFRRNLNFEDLRDGIRITAVGDRPVFVNLLLNAYGAAAPAAESAQLDIVRSYFDLNGNALNPHRLRTGDLVLVRLDVNSRTRVSEALVVDLLPAGLELENQNLAASFKLDHLVVASRRIDAWRADLRLAHEEFRDDRYVAAVDIDPFQPAVLFYLARAVTPGTFKVPNALVEDMYRPYLRAVGEPFQAITVVQP
jgi:alpha-2-macroglobulin